MWNKFGSLKAPSNLDYFVWRAVHEKKYLCLKVDNMVLSIYLLIYLLIGIACVNNIKLDNHLLHHCGGAQEI